MTSCWSPACGLRDVICPEKQPWNTNYKVVNYEVQIILIREKLIFVENVVYFNFIKEFIIPIINHFPVDCKVSIYGC